MSSVRRMVLSLESYRTPSQYRRGWSCRADLVLFFALSRRQLEARFSALATVIAPKGALWIAWPKRASGVATDVTETCVRETGLAARVVDIKVCAIDATWSGLKFVVRLADLGSSGVI